MTPRKPNQRQPPHRHAPSNLIQASDYESDVQFYNQTPIPPPTRTNTELNFSVLRRYNPKIRSILSIAANAVIYSFTPTTQEWDKSGVEGTLFVCDQESPIEASYCIVVLNRRGLDNLILDLAMAQDVEVTPELLIVRIEEAGVDASAQKVLGIWIHEDKDDTREINLGLIKQCWERAMSVKGKGVDPPQAQGNVGNGSFSIDGGTVKPAEGRRISLTDLFQHQ